MIQKIFLVPAGQSRFFCRIIYGRKDTGGWNLTRPRCSAKIIQRCRDSIWYPGNRKGEYFFSLLIWDVNIFIVCLREKKFDSMQNIFCRRVSSRTKDDFNFFCIFETSHLFSNCNQPHWFIQKRLIVRLIKIRMVRVNEWVRECRPQPPCYFLWDSKNTLKDSNLLCFY